MARAVARRYAKALADVVLDPRKGMDAEVAARELAFFDEALSSSVELRNVLLSPAIPAAKKRAVVARLSQSAGVSKAMQNFLCVVVDHRRVGLFGQIREAFQTEIDERRGLVGVSVSTARPVGDDTRERIVKAVEELTGKRVRAGFSVDPELIGGLVVRVGSTVYDGSVRGQLAMLRQKLME